jgi:hypothetical protein
MSDSESKEKFMRGLKLLPDLPDTKSPLFEFDALFKVYIKNHPGNKYSYPLFNTYYRGLGHR